MSTDIQRGDGGFPPSHVDMADNVKPDKQANDVVERGSDGAPAVLQEFGNAVTITEEHEQS